jgi:hypothetical protein
VAKAGDQIVTRIEDIVVQESRSYLDIAVVSHIWDEWKLSEAFDYDSTGGHLPTHAVARVLTINRCTDPCANYSVPAWALKTALSEVLRIDLSVLNDDKIYYELDKIHKNQISIENHLFRKTYEKNAEVKTLKRNINACKTRFGLADGNVTLVFDRGIISDDNGAMIEDASMKYISALDRNQIPTCGIDLAAFEDLGISETDKSQTRPPALRNTMK